MSNTRAGTLLRQLELRTPSGYSIQGGLGPPGWTVTRVASGGNWSIRFQVASCASGGIASGQSGTFRVDLTPPGGAIAADTTDALNRITPSDPCGGATGWTVTTASSVTWPRKTLLVTGTVSPAQGAPPLTATATYTVTNLTSSTRAGIALSPTVTPAAGSSCTPASLTLASGASGSFTCTSSLAAGTWDFAATAAAGTATAAGARAGTVTAAAMTATFAFDDLAAGPGDQVRATLSVRNNGAVALTATPPAYGALGLQNLVRASGTTDPAATSVPAGATRTFVYALDVTGAVGSSYVAQGTASSPAGPTNLAVTPAGTVSASFVGWSPPAVVRTRTSPPYLFTVTVRNGSAASVSDVRIVNPQNGLWTGMGNAGTSTGLRYQSRTVNGSTTTLRYSGTLASGATATLQFSFTGVPAVTQTTSYPFQVNVYPSGGGQFFTSYSVTAAVAVPIPDVSGLSVLSTTNGQILAWTNTSRADAPHEGVVVFRRAAPGVPTVPADFVDYGIPANQPSDFFYEDGEASLATTLADPATGAFNYRVCNRDPLFVYSSCNTGFWNGQGWLDSVAAPAGGGWAHQLGGAIFLLPGLVPGNRVGVTTNAPSLAVLDLATGDRAFDPLQLVSLPGTFSPAVRTTDGRALLLSADTGGNVRAFDLGTGAQAWGVALAGESFVAGVAAIVRQYATPGFQAAYPMDVVLLASTSGRILALHAGTGATLWSLATGVPAGLRALPWFDYATSWLYAATDGGGVLAYDLSTSAPGVPPSPAAGWSNPGGAYRFGCVRAPASTQLACVDRTGLLRVLEKPTGAVAASIATGATSPSGLLRVTGSTQGFVVSSAARVVRVLASGTPTVLTVGGEWAPVGVTLSLAQVFPGSGEIVVAGSDGKLHELSLGNAQPTGASFAISSQAPSVLLGPPAYDVVNDLFVFGTEDGRVWAVKRSALAVSGP